MTFDPNYLIISPKLKFRFVYVPKCACTGWKMLMSDAEGGQYSRPGEVHIQRNAKYLNIINSGSDFFVNYKDFPLYTMIRDPIERLVSAYIDKIARRNLTNNASDFWYKLRQEYEKFLNGDACSLEAFVEWICSDKTPKLYSNNDHWRPYSKIIGDTNQYDFIFLLQDLDAHTSSRHIPQTARNLLDLFPAKTKSAPHANSANPNKRSIEITSRCMELFNGYYREDLMIYLKLKQH